MFSTSVLMAALTLMGSATASPMDQYYHSKRACDTSTLNTTTSSWPVTSTDTIYSIAASVNRGVCDIARANRMADATLMIAGEALVIPGEACEEDNTSCLIVSSNFTSDCVYGGPHVYTTVYNDTLEYVATKLEISVESLNTSGISDTSAIIESGQSIKVPQCDPSLCIVQPYQFIYGTYKDLAKNYSTTVGQILAFNPSYNYSSAAVGDGPVITLPINCTALSSDITVIS